MEIARNFSISLFQSTSPVRGTTSVVRVQIPVHHRFQSTSPVRGTTALCASLELSADISIHVPREGDDQQTGEKEVDFIISIHVPREGDDTNPHASIWVICYFNPRPP